MRLTISNIEGSLEIPEQSKCLPRIDTILDSYDSRVYLCVVKPSSSRLLGDIVTINNGDVAYYHRAKQNIERKLQQEVERNALQSV